VRKKGGFGGLRLEIGRIDAALLRLLNRRARIVARIHAKKARDGVSIYDAQRTDAILARVLGLNRGPLRDEQVRELFTFLLHHYALEHRPARRPPKPPRLLARAAPGAEPAAVRRLCARHGLKLLPRGRGRRGLAPFALAKGLVLAVRGDEDDEALADLCHRAKLISLALRPWPGAGRGR
jgi:chorismate mutase